VLSVAADDAEIGDQLALARRGDAGAGLLDDPNQFVAGNERERPLEIRVAAAPDEAVREPGPGGEHLDADLPGPGLGTSGCCTSSSTSGPPKRDVRMLCQAMIAPWERKLRRKFTRSQ
jgi:hypothetical protein